MDRKDFLKYSGLALAAVVGLKTVVSIFTEPDAIINKETTIVEKIETSTRGFGGGRYGV